MKKRFWACLMALVMCLFSLAGCTRHATKNTDSGAAEEIYAMILDSPDSREQQLAADGFKAAMAAAGAECEIYTPTSNVNTASEQLAWVERLTERRVACIAISPYDADALGDALKAAMKSGVDVCSFDHMAGNTSREVHVSATGTEEIAKTLMDAVLDLSGGSGDWAILSASSTASSQNEWISRMKETMSGDEYKDLQLMEIAYGDGQYQKSYDQAKALLTSYPDLKVLCVPTTTACAAACACVKDLKSNVKVTGLGLPSAMTDYVGTDNVCPYFFLWNPVNLGYLTAYVSMDLYQDTGLTGAVGDVFSAGNLGSFTVTEASDEGTEIILGAPYKYDASNIGEWTSSF